MKKRKNPVAKRHRQPLRDIEKVEPARTQRTGSRNIIDLSKTTVEWVGCVISPKYMRPYFVLRRSISEGCLLCVPTTKLSAVEVVGSAYLEDSEYSEYADPAKFTGYPRVHTPQGVGEQGTGLGTALYTAASMLGAYFVVGKEDGEKLTEIPDDLLLNPGCSSGPDASESARSWWENAERRGLAESVEGGGNSEVEEDRQVEIELYVDVDLMEALDRNVASIAFSEAARTRNREAEILEEVDLDDFVVDIIGLDDVHVPYQTANVEVTALVTVYYNDDEDYKELELTRNFVIGIDNDEINAARLEHSFTDIDNLTGSDYETIQEKVGEDVEVSTIEFEKFTNFDPEEVTILANATYDLSGRTESSKNVTYYIYPFNNAMENDLVLDMTKTLIDEFEGGLDAPMQRERMKTIVLNLDLAEVEDPEAFKFFFGLADYLGASATELRRFKNSVLAYRGDIPSEVADAEEFDPEYGMAPGLKKYRYRINPSNEKDYESIGRELFGDLVDLD